MSTYLEIVQMSNVRGVGKYIVVCLHLRYSVQPEKWTNHDYIQLMILSHKHNVDQKKRGRKQCMLFVFGHVYACEKIMRKVRGEAEFTI